MNGVECVVDGAVLSPAADGVFVDETIQWHFLFII
jgi:hypothetical protein